MAGEILHRLILIALLIVMQVPVAYLVVKFLIYEDGLWGGFRKLRQLTGIVEYAGMNDDGGEYKIRRIERKWWGSQVLYCYNCLSPYVCLVVAIAAAHIASAVTEITVGESVAKLGEGFGLTLLGLVMWLPLTGLTVMAFDYLGTP
jgi:hypothetical protein